MDQAREFFASDEGRALLQPAFWTVVAAVVVWLLGRAAQLALLKNITKIEERHRLRTRITWATVGTFFIATALIWASFLNNLNLGMFLGIIGAGLALSLQETLLCIAGWLLIILRTPFDVGDRIEMDGRAGDVIDIRMFQTTLLEIGNWVHADQSTGRMVSIPNSMILRHAVYNYTKGFPFIWNELSIIVTFESDWKEAKAILLKTAQHEAEKIETQVKSQIQAMQKQYAIHYDRFTPIVYTSIHDVGAELTLRYLTPARQRRSTAHRIAEEVLTALIAHPQIDFAYPTIRIYRNTEEGKTALGGPARPDAPPPPRAME